VLSIDPRVGTEGAGNTIIGPSLPFGMVKPGPDTGKNDRNSGWGPEGDINGFSQTHVSGTGGGAKYGNILVQPVVGPIAPADFGSPRKDETVSLGYYAVELSRYGIKAEVTTAARAALYRFTFPKSTESHLVFDVGHCLNSRNWGEDQNVVASTVEVRSPTEIAGSSSVTGGWNRQSTPYTVYFYAVSDTASVSSGVWEGSNLRPGQKKGDGAPAQAGAWLDFHTQAGQQIRLKVGISFVSVAQARTNALQQIAAFDFDQTRAAAVKAWMEALAPVQITGGTDAQRTMFYTSIYHAMLMPVDRTGENPLWRSPEPSYDDFYAIWDTFRSSHPLFTLIAPSREVEMIRSLIDIQRHEGFLPDARSGNVSGQTQGGSNTDTLLADAFVKSLPGIDWEKAYAAIVKDAEVAPPDQLREGRGGLEDWKKLGYCSIEGVDRPGNKTMEYAYNDFGVSLLAAGLGKTADAAKYRKRASQWQNLWDPKFSDGGFSGFVRPRHRDGSWKSDFTALQGCSWGGDTFYEGNSWTYSFYAPQDIAGLIGKCGGDEAFVRRLDAFFDGPGRWDVSNEPGFLTPYLYVWAGRADKTAERVYTILTEKFHPTPGGIPGNDDSGAMGSWYAFSALGFFPVAGQDIYILGTPLFPSVSLKLANGKTFTLEAKDISAKNIHITSAEWDGRPLTTAWFRHGDLMKGGKLVLHMGATPAKWPTGVPPPSPLLE